MQERNIPYRRFNTEEFPEDTNCTIVLENKRKLIKIKTDRWTLGYDDIKSIWYRRPKISEMNNTTLSKEDYSFCVREINSFLLSLWSMLKDKKWVNDPFKLYLAERKSIQLKIAFECNMNIPQTLFSNDWYEIKDFIDKKERKVIVKPISHGGFGSKDEYAIFTNDLETCEFKMDESIVKISPFIIQEKIEKIFDVRVTVIGKRIFAHKIISYPNVHEIDWRVLKPTEMTYESIELSADLRKSILKFVAKFKLHYGAFDFAVDSNAKWWFLEINPSGQFVWLEIATGTRMIDSLIDILAE